MPQYLICANLTHMRNSLRSCQEPKVKLSYEKGIVFITKMEKSKCMVYNCNQLLWALRQGHYKFEGSLAISVRPFLKMEEKPGVGFKGPRVCLSSSTPLSVRD